MLFIFCMSAHTPIRNYLNSCILWHSSDNLWCFRPWFLLVSGLGSSPTGRPRRSGCWRSCRRWTSTYRRGCGCRTRRRSTLTSWSGSLPRPPVSSIQKTRNILTFFYFKKITRCNTILKRLLLTCYKFVSMAFSLKLKSWNFTNIYWRLLTSSTWRWCPPETSPPRPSPARSSMPSDR